MSTLALLQENRPQVLRIMESCPRKQSMFENSEPRPIPGQKMARVQPSE